MIAAYPGLAYIGIGIVAGFFAGLLGIGGGIVMVPLLGMMFAATGLPPESNLQLALGTSMAAIIFSSAASLTTHHRHGAVLWLVVRAFTPGILAGTALGTVLARHVSTHALTLFFACFVILVAMQMIFQFAPSTRRPLPGWLGLAATAMGIGMVSSLVAIGGGTMTVPFLTWCNVQVRQAIGTSAAVGLPIAIGGTVGYIVNGRLVEGLPDGALGYVYLPALGWMVLASLLTAPLGARTAHRLPMKVLRRIFAGLLLALAAKMLWSLQAS